MIDLRLAGLGLDLRCRADSLAFSAMDQIVYRRLMPEPGETDAHTLLESLALTHRDPAVARPYTLVNFVASADGRVKVDGRSAALGDAGDKELFRSLRERSDAVLAGVNTMLIENYGRLLPHAARRQRRRTAGRSDEPLACLITRSGALPLSIPLFAEPEARIVVFAPTEPDLSRTAAQVSYEPLLPGQPALTTAMQVLRERYDVQTLLCEGGPTLFGGLLREGLADELFLTIAPKLAGPSGEGSVVAGGPPLDRLLPLRLLAALEREGTLFLRYGIANLTA